MLPTPTDDPRADLDAAVREAFERAQVPWLRALVDTPSCTRAPDDVEAAARLLDAEAERLGLAVARHPDPEGRFADHRVYATPAAGDGPALALVGHVDTVFPRALGFLTFTREGDVIRGPGVLDMKSGLSAILFALRALQAVDGEAFGRLRARVVIATDEEVGSPSSAALYRRLAPATTRALVFEAGREEDRIVTSRKGGAAFVVEVRGRAAHAGNHHAEGVSAIHGLSLIVPRLEAITDPGRGVTVNVGLVEGGTAKNTVPDRARAEVDARFVDPADGPPLEAAVRSAVQAPWPPDAPAQLARLEVRRTGGITRPPMTATVGSQALRRRYEAHAAAVGLRTGEAPRQGGGSDANLLSGAGVPSIDGLGPYGRHFHRTDEWSSLDSLRRRTAALARFLHEEAQEAP
ncbi:MAG: M20/M25/M40 family metallo-hydrolase [Sandaracinaceae bacterium]